MRSTGITLLAAVALGVVTYHYNSPRPDVAQQLANITRIHTNAPVVDGSEDGARPRVFSPQRPLLSSGATAGGATSRAASAGDIRTAATPPALAPLPPVVAIQPRKAAAPELAGHKLTSSKPIDEEARYTLIRDLQKELRRVGCYEGEIDGDWGGGSKRAMRHFTERVNASLPTEDPDYILLMLVRGHNATACGKSCPTGQAFDADGTCMPSAIVASTGKRPVPATRDTNGQAVPGAPPAAASGERPLSQRVAAAAPTPSDTGAAGNPWWRTEQPSVPVAPLPGRMSVGGPVDSSAVAPRSITGSAPSARLANLGEIGGERGPALPSIGEPRPASRPMAIENGERRPASGRSQREQRARPSARRAPARDYAPPRPRNSSRYTSFNRPGAVHNFFFGAQRSF